MTPILGLVVGLAFGGSVVLLGAAWLGWRPALGSTSRNRPSGNPALGTTAVRRAAIAAAVGLVVAVVSRWPVAAIAAAGLVWLWPALFGGSREGVRRLGQLEALAIWTETMRDSIAGTIGLEQAIRHSLGTAPTAIRAPLARLDGRLHAHMPLTRALGEFGDDLGDASADLVVASLILNSQLRGPGLTGTLSALATSTRAELDLQRQVEERRRTMRRSALIMVGISVTFAGAITVFTRPYVEPYGTPGGQLVLVLVLGLFAGGLMWMRHAAATKPAPRFLRNAEEISTLGGAR